MRKYFLIAVLLIALLIAPYVGAGCPGCGQGLDGFGVAGGLDGAASMSSLNDGLISFWKLDELSGIRHDAINGNHLTDNNTVLSNSGVSAWTLNAGQFVRANAEYLSHVDNPSLSMGDIDFTIIVWGYLNSFPGPSMMLAAKWHDIIPRQREYALYFQGAPTNQFAFVVSSNGIASSGIVASSFGSPLLDTWYFIVAWHDNVSNSINIQVNNGAIDTLPGYSAGVFDGTANFNLGAQNNAGAFFTDGRVDAAGLWKRLPTPAERTFLYNGGFGRQHPF